MTSTPPQPPHWTRTWALDSHISIHTHCSRPGLPSSCTLDDLDSVFLWLHRSVFCHLQRLGVFAFSCRLVEAQMGCTTPSIDTANFLASQIADVFKESIQSVE